MEEIWALILAAGESKRMKVPKMLLPIEGKAMIERVIENVTASGIKKIIVVLGSAKDQILGIIKHLPVEFCYNEKYRNGMLSSVRCGFRNLPEEYKAVIVFQGDQPMIEPWVVTRLISAYRQTKKKIVIPVYKKKRGHPLLIDRKYRDEIYKLDDRLGLRSLAAKFPRDVLEVVVNTPDILRDIDTKEDYLNELNQI
jgi:molybdenum cofactor cytidylyltransferase